MGILTFANVWCLMLFFVLAFSARPDSDALPLDYVAAPKALRWKKMLRLNTLLSIGVTLVIAFIVKSGLIPLHTILE